MINPEEIIQAQEWYTCNVSKKELKDFLIRDNYHANIYFGLWFVLIFASGYLAYRVFPKAWAIPVFFFYGGFFQWTFIWLQHVGLAENVWDHRLNTRSIQLNFLFSFLFMNMESHIEHHLYPTVSFHALPKLSQRLKGQLP